MAQGGRETVQARPMALRLRLAGRDSRCRCLVYRPARRPQLLEAVLTSTAVVAFAERGPRLTAARQAELADLTEPLIHARGETAVTRLYGVANWLLGRR